MEEACISTKAKITTISRGLEENHDALMANPMDPSVHKEEVEFQSRVGYWLSKEEDEMRQKSKELATAWRQEYKVFSQCCKVR